MSVAIALVLLAADPWAGCEIQGPSPGVELRAVCDRVWVSVTVDKPAEAGKAAMLEVVDRLVEDAPVTSDGAFTELKLGAKSYPARSYRPKDTWGYVVLLPAGEGRVRMAQCEEKREGKCSKLFSALIEKLPAPTKTTTESPLRFGGKTITLGPKCRNPKPARVECADSALTWSHFPLNEEGVFEVSVNALEVGLGRLGTVARANVDCTVAGAATKCVLLTITKPDGKELFTVFGVGKTETEQVAAQCNTAAQLPSVGTKPDSGATGFVPTAASTLPAPCDQAITIDR